jgi:hypothetical protein
MKFLFVKFVGHGLIFGGCCNLFRNFDLNILIIDPYILQSCKWLVDAKYLTSAWNSTSTLFNFLFSTVGYKSKYDGLWQEYRGYGYCDICKWRTSIPFFLDGTFQFQYTSKLNAQNTLSLGTCKVGDILVVIHSCFLLDHLLGRGDFGTIGYARTTSNGKTTTFVSFATKSNICSSCHVHI